MSDVGMSAPPPASAPPASGPPQTAPAQRSDVPINPGPNLPTPIGSQAPNVRESVAEAYRKSRDPEWQKNRPGPAQATKGHNNPPEETPTERPKTPPPLDLKRRPDDQPGAQTGRKRDGQQRERGEGGRFAPQAPNNAQFARVTSQVPGNTGVRTAQNGAQNSAPNNAPNNVQQLPPHAPYREPPPRMAPAAKQAWAAAPESVRSEFHRMHVEFGRAAQQFQRDRQVMDEIRPYADLAHQHGTTLGRALKNYVSIEDKLRADPIAGLDQIVNNMNLQTADGQRLGLRDISYHVLSQTPEQIRAMQTANQQAAMAQQLAQTRQQQAWLAQQQQQMQNEQQFRQARSWVDRFAEAHPRLDELGPVVEREMKLGFSIDHAYQRACLLYPANGAQAPRAGVAQQQRIPDRSIRGAPDSGPNNGGSRRSPRMTARSPRDSVAAAFRQFSSAL